MTTGCDRVGCVGDAWAEARYSDDGRKWISEKLCLPHANLSLRRHALVSLTVLQSFTIEAFATNMTGNP